MCICIHTHYTIMRICMMCHDVPISQCHHDMWWYYRHHCHHDGGTYHWRRHILIVLPSLSSRCEHTYLWYVVDNFAPLMVPLEWIHCWSAVAADVSALTASWKQEYFLLFNVSNTDTDIIRYDIVITTQWWSTRRKSQHDWLELPFILHFGDPTQTPFLVAWSWGLQTQPHFFEAFLAVT